MLPIDPTKMAKGIFLPPLPDHWVRLMSLLQLHFPNVVLGGGALRDLITGKPVKDLDFFAAPTGQHDAEFLRSTLHAEQPIAESIEDYECAHKVTQVWEFTYREAAAQLVLITSPEWEPGDVKTIVETFDIGLCQVGVTLNTAYMSQAFHEDYHNGKLTVVHDKTPISTVKRLMRLAGPDKKYQDWKVDPGTGNTGVLYHMEMDHLFRDALGG